MIRGLLAPLLLALPAAAGTVYVDASLATGANDGSSWSDAFRGPAGVQAALAAAQPGDQVWVARGSYLPSASGVRTISFVLRSGVELYGGFAGGETQLSQRDVDANPTVLDGDLSGNDAAGQFGDNSLHVVSCGTADSTALLDGFTVRGGNANGSADANYGAGIFCDAGATPRVLGCRVRENRAGFGAGIYARNSTPQVSRTRIESNLAQFRGGGLMIETPVLDFVLAECVLDSNTAGAGGGAYTQGGVSNVFRQCLFANNVGTGSSGYSGGALYSYGVATLVHCTVVGNHSQFSATGGIETEQLGNVGLHGTIVYFNEGPGGAQGLVNNVSGVVSGSWSCVQGGLAGPGMLAADPQFVALATGDLHLSNTSPCCDAGNDLQAAGIAFDLDGAPRLVDNPAADDSGVGPGPIVDMGAYEAPNVLYAPFCAGDGSLPTACPCGNTGEAGRGCRSSDFFSPGALLVAAGTTSPDTLVLHGSDIFPSGTCVFLQGDQANASGVVFGDGVRCVAGSLKRLFVKPASSAAVSAPAAGEPSIGARSAALGDPIAPGSQRWYQVYYRDPDLGFCPAPQGRTWNISGGVVVNW